MNRQNTELRFDIMINAWGSGSLSLEIKAKK